MTVYITPLDEDGRPTGERRELEGVIRITYEHHLDEDLEPIMPFTGTWSGFTTFRLLRYSRAQRRAFQSIAGVTYVERQRARKKKSLKKTRKVRP